MFNQLDYQQEGFDFASLDVLEVIHQTDANCEHVTEKITVHRYDWMGENGDVRSEKIAIGSTIEEEIVTIIDENENDAEYSVKIKPRLNCHDQTDEVVVEHMRSHVEKQSPGSLVSGSSDHFSKAVARMIDQRLFYEERKGGYFVEAMTYDEQPESLSLYFEREHGWSGLIIEPLPWAYKKIAKERNAWTLQSCLSTITSPTTVNFTTNLEKSKNIKVQCFPLYSILLGVDNPKVDLLVLNMDSEGYRVLVTMPWDKVDIAVIAVKIVFDESEGSSKVLNLLESKEYIHIDSLYDRMVFTKLDAREVCPEVRKENFLQRTSVPSCYIFNTEMEKSFRFCQHHFPLDFSSTSDLTSDILFWTSQVLGLSDKLLVVISYSLSVVVNILYYACHNCFLVI